MRSFSALISIPFLLLHSTDRSIAAERAEKINNVFKVETGSEGKAKFVEQIDTKFQLSASTPRMVALFLFIVTN